MKNPMNKKLKIMCILFIAIAVILIIFLLFFWKVNKSILGEMGIGHIFEVKEIRLAQYDYIAEENLSMSDKIKLFVILSHTEKYSKDKHKPYLPEGAFLLHPNVSFRNGFSNRGHGIYWEYEKGILEYTYPGDSAKKSSKYFLEQKYAQKLKVLFDKYTMVGGTE